MGVCEMKKKLLSFILVLALFACMIPTTAGAVSVSDFTDIKPETWYYDAVNYAAENGLFSGTSPTTFSHPFIYVYGSLIYGHLKSIYPAPFTVFTK